MLLRRRRDSVISCELIFYGNFSHVGPPAATPAPQGATKPRHLNRLKTEQKTRTRPKLVSVIVDRRHRGKLQPHRSSLSRLCLSVCPGKRGKHTRKEAASDLYSASTTPYSSTRASRTRGSGSWKSRREPYRHMRSVPENAQNVVHVRYIRE